MLSEKLRVGLEGATDKEKCVVLMALQHLVQELEDSETPEDDPLMFLAWEMTKGMINMDFSRAFLFLKD